MNAPILFCHYGNSTYLPYVLEVARLTNPDKEIFLLGDQDNRWLGAAKNIKHYFFDDYRYGNEIETFDLVYRLVQGKRHNPIRGGKDWVNFVFKRWFYINNFLISQGIDDFWHFDSDNMILDALARHEKKFRRYDCTEQCNGICMNGYISKRSVVSQYIRTINGIFQNQKYLEDLQREFDQENEDFAFTEMRAYKIFKESKEYPIHSIRLNTIIDGSTFDDCICQEHGMEMERILYSKDIKKVYLSPHGEFYCQEKASHHFVKMNSLNLSWVPDSLFKIVLHQARKQSRRRGKGELNIAGLPTLGRTYNMRNSYKIKIKHLKTLLKKLFRCGNPRRK